MRSTSVYPRRIVIPFQTVPHRRGYRHRASKEPEFGQEENILSISDIVHEASELGNDFIFTDDSNEPVFEFEHLIKGAPEEISAEMPEIRNALDVGALDITSAYAPEQGFKEITVDVLKEKLDENAFALVLDVRGVDEFKSGHVPGARNVPLTELNSEYVASSDLKDFKQKSIAVICGIGKRSAQATVRLTKVLGFEDVTNVAAGTKEWTAKGYSLE